jgi:hypothetical protein
MSLYNMIHGATIATFFVLPMLGKHPDEYPRFRGCFIADEGHPEYDDHIHVYTRVGGGNRGCDFGEEKLYDMPEFVTTFDDSFDSTYATYVFKVPDKWKADFELFKQGKPKEFSQEYKEEIIRVFPKIEGKLKEVLWRKET